LPAPDPPLFLKSSTADRRYLIPSAGPAWARALRRIAGAEGVDLVIPPPTRTSTTSPAGSALSACPLPSPPTPQSPETRALLAQFKKGVRAVEKKWKAAAARAKKRQAAAKRRKRSR
jgi:hypothetical protein